MFLKTAKKIWDTLREIYDKGKNIFRVLELYKCFFTLQQGEMSVIAYYSALRGILDELDIHEP